MELRQYAAILWRWKWLIIAGVVLAAGTAFVASRVQTPVYEATTDLLINEAPSEGTSDYTAILTSERLARTYAQMLVNRPVLQETLSRLDMPVGVQELESLKNAIDVQLVRDTQLITVSVEDTSPLLAAQIANTLAEVFAAQNEDMQASRFAASKESLSQELDQISALIQETETKVNALQAPLDNGERAEKDQLEANLAQYRQSYTNLLQSFETLRVAEAQTVSNVVQVEPATPPVTPVRPRTMMNTLLAAIVGGMIAVGAIFLIEYLDTSIKTPEQVMAAFELPMLGLIGKLEEEREPHSAANPRSPITEAFRKLRSNIEFSAVGRPIHTLLVTSPGPGEGKSTVATNLAVVMAQGGKQVVLLDADLRKPRVHQIMNVTNRMGLSDLFVREPLIFDGAVRKWRTEKLALITSGGLPPNPAELLGSERMADILTKLTERADVVVIDTPPMSAVTDAVLLAARVDAVLLVLEPGTTPMGAAEQAMDQLKLAGANLIGFVMNNVDLQRGGYYSGYYSGYYEYYEDGRGKRRKPKRRQKGQTAVRSRLGLLDRVRPDLNEE
jgi:capsular exopolysaccharide synthesis family protein